MGRPAGSSQKPPTARSLSLVATIGSASTPQLLIGSLSGLLVERRRRGLMSPGGRGRGLCPLSRRCYQHLLLCSPKPEQLQQVVRGRDQVPLTVNLVQASQQKAA